jgi:hypothetical protein
MPNFETFHRIELAWSNEPLVTIQRRHLISLNASAYRAIASPDSVELLYDSQARIVGLRPAESARDTAHPVRRSSPTAGPYLISATAFLRFHQLDVKVSTRWPAYVDNGVLCVDLATPGTAVTSNRARTERGDGGSPPQPTDASSP